MNYLINVTEKPIKTILISYNVKQEYSLNRETYILTKVVENWYKHPDAPDIGRIIIMEETQPEKIQHGHDLYEACKIHYLSGINLKKIEKLKCTDEKFNLRGWFNE